MAHLTDVIAETADSARKALRDDKLSAALAAKLSAQLAKQDQRLDILNARVSDLANQRRGGGFPWLLILVAGAGYALYRANPGLLDQVRNLLGQAGPGAEGNLKRAGADLKGAVQDGLDGDDPRGSLKSAAGELKRAGEKTVDTAADKLSDLKRDAERKIDDLKH
jgi:hypothetical protein